MRLVKELVWDARYAIYLAFMSILSLLGLFLSPFFYVCFLLDYFRLPDGVLVLNAVILGGPNLVRSFVLGMIVIICFGFYSYAYFSNIVNQEQEVCHSPLQCVAKHILDSVTGDLSTVLGNDFGNFAFPALVLWEDTWEGWRTTFVFISLIFWVFLLQSIIQGQIIDAFAEMRARRTAALSDLEEKCFVSSIDRFTFNSYPGEWEKRRGGMYAWNYVHFTSYLFEKSSEEYTGLENAVCEAFKSSDISFFPIEQLVLRQRSQFADEEAMGPSMEEASLREEMKKLRGEMAEMRGRGALVNSVSSRLGLASVTPPAGLSAPSGQIAREPYDLASAVLGGPTGTPSSSDASRGRRWASSGGGEDGGDTRQAKSTQAQQGMAEWDEGPNELIGDGAIYVARGSPAAEVEPASDFSTGRLGRGTELSSLRMPLFGRASPWEEEEEEEDFEALPGTSGEA